MYKKILVAVDDSEISIQALHEAIGLSKEQQAKLRIIHIVDEYYVDYVGLGIDYVQLEASFKEYGQKILANMVAIARQSNVDFDSQLIEIKTSGGRIAEKIVEVAKVWPADLLVIGTHGRRGFHHFLLGSVAEGVIRIASMPVLLIRGKEK
jgi:nucleotide-binding universal stress UspA family protein